METDEMFGIKLREKLGRNSSNVAVVQLSAILSKQRDEKLFMYTLMELALKASVPMPLPLLLPGQKDFENRAFRILAGMMK